MIHDELRNRSKITGVEANMFDTKVDEPDIVKKCTYCKKFTYLSYATNNISNTHKKGNADTCLSAACIKV
jgi:hypothetical protein